MLWLSYLHLVQHLWVVVKGTPDIKHKGTKSTAFIYKTEVKTHSCRKCVWSAGGIGEVAGGLEVL